MYCFLWHLFLFFNVCHFFLSLHSSRILSHYLARKDTQIMRSYNRPGGQCLLCMSVLILYLSGNQTESTREPGRGTAMVRGFQRKEVELGVPLHGRNLVHVLCGLPGWCATPPPGSALDKTPMEISCAISKTQREGESLLNSTPVLSTKPGVGPL